MLQRSPEEHMVSEANTIWLCDWNCKYSHLFSVARMDVSHKTFMILNKNWSQILQTMCRGNVFWDRVIRRFSNFGSFEREKTKLNDYTSKYTVYVYNDCIVEQNGLTSI